MYDSFAGAPHFWSPGAFGPSYCQPPVIPGHEFVGDVVEMGENALKNGQFKIGDQCIAEQIVPCNKCRLCEKGDYNMCMPHNIYGFRQATPGAMSTFMKYVDGSRIHKISKSIPPEEAVFVEPLSCGIHAANRASIELNDVVVVSGVGPIGCGAIAAARLKNPSLIVALDMFDWKLDIAKKCGADVVINPGKENAIKSVEELTNGYGCDKYIECSGKPISVIQGLDMIARKGIFVEYSVFGEKTNVDWTVISDAKEIEIRGGHLGPYQYPVAIRMIENGLIPVKDLVTHVVPMSQFEKGFKLVDASSESIKVTLDPDN